MAKTRIHRTDKNEPEIIEHLEAVGVLVEKIGQPVDLLTSYASRFENLQTKSCVLIEVKESLEARINRKQMNFIAHTAFDVGVAASPEEAETLAKFGKGKITDQEKWKIAKFLLHSQAKRISTKDFF